jgi:hypothetical protein
MSPAIEFFLVGCLPAIVGGGFFESSFEDQKYEATKKHVMFTRIVGVISMAAGTISFFVSYYHLFAASSIFLSIISAVATSFVMSGIGYIMGICTSRSSRTN